MEHTTDMIGNNSDVEEEFGGDVGMDMTPTGSEGGEGKKEYEDKSKSFSDQEELPDINTEKLVMKEAFLDNPQEVTIKAVKMNVYGKPCLSILHDTNEDLCGQVNISSTAYMLLKEKFGNKASDFKNKKVVLEAFPFEKEQTRKGKTQVLKGYEIKVSFP